MSGAWEEVAHLVEQVERIHKTLGQIESEGFGGELEQSVEAVLRTALGGLRAQVGFTVNVMMGVAKAMEMADDEADAGS